MSYVYVDLEFENPNDLRDPFKLIELHLEIVNVIPRRNLLGSNFNKYWGPEFGEFHPHISVRLHLKDVEASRPEIMKKADQLMSSGRIRFHSELKEWREPDFVARAHELGTQCSLIMIDELKKKAELLAYLKRNSTEFFLHLLSETLKRAGFKVNILWTYLRSKPTTELTEASTRLAKEFQRATGEIDPDPDFLERFLHAFLNCLGPSGFEDHFIQLLMKGEAWRDLAHSRRGES